jgi:hypothetical protein
MLGTTVRAVLWTWVLVKGIQILAAGVNATAEGMKMPDKQA